MLLNHQPVQLCLIWVLKDTCLVSCEVCFLSDWFLVMDDVKISKFDRFWFNFLEKISILNNDRFFPPTWLVAGSIAPCRSGVLDCQEWAKRPLAASGARWTNRGGWRGHKGSLIGREGERGEAGSFRSVVVGSFGRSCDVSQLLGGWLTAGRVATSQACFNNQQLASLWRARLLTSWSVTTAVAMPLKLFSGWSLHRIGSVTLPPTTQWLRRNPSSPVDSLEGTMDGIIAV